MSPDSRYGQVDLTRIRLRRTICDAILALLDVDAPIQDVVDLCYDLQGTISRSSRKDDLKDVLADLETTSNEGIVAMIKEDREMQLIEHHDRWLGYVREPREGESEEERLHRLAKFGIAP